jgi:hypothetical protein
MTMMIMREGWSMGGEAALLHPFNPDGLVVIPTERRNLILKVLSGFTCQEH